LPKFHLATLNIYQFFISLVAFTRVCQDKEEHQELKEILVPMDPLDWMELKARREQR